MLLLITLVPDANNNPTTTKQTKPPLNCIKKGERTTLRGEIILMFVIFNKILLIKLLVMLQNVDMSNYDKKIKKW